MTILITGGAGFIGANFVLDWLASNDEPVINLDKLTYAGNLETLASLQDDARHIFVQGDIGDSALIASLLAQHQPRAVLNFAAESHVDRSIHSPRRLHPDQHRRHFSPTGVGASLLESTRSQSRCGIPVPARLHRRGLWLAGRRRPGLHGRPSLRTQQPVLGQQGRQRPPGARLPPHLRPVSLP